MSKPLKLRIKVKSLARLIPPIHCVAQTCLPGKSPAKQSYASAHAHALTRILARTQCGSRCEGTLVLPHPVFVSFPVPFFFFKGRTRGIWRFPGRGETNRSCSCWHMPADAATQDPSHVWDLHHRSRRRRTLNPLSKARDGTVILMDVTRVR